MFNEFGRKSDGEIVHISDYKKSQIVYCEFCNNKLIAKKGRVKIHHFAHKQNESCKVYFEGMNNVDFQLYKTLSKTQALLIRKMVESRSNGFYLVFSYEDYYNNVFNIGTDFKKQQNRTIGNCTFKTIKALEKKGFIKGLRRYSNKYFELTNLSKLYMLDFNFKEAIKFFEWQSGEVENTELIATYNRLKTLTLYFIDITTSNDNFQKIGITGDYDRRKSEILRFLKKDFEGVKIKELKLCKLATLEHYFKKKYSEFNFKIGSKTEYFKFNKEQIESIKKELFKAQLSTKNHVQKIKEGLKNRSKKGRGKISTNDFLKRDLSKKIIILLNEKISIRKIANKLDCSTGTVQKVKKLL